MIEETDSFFDGLDRTFIEYSAKLEAPLYWAYGLVRYRAFSPLGPNQFDNTSSKIRELATRTFILAAASLAFTFAATHLAITAVVIGTCAKVLRAVGFSLQKNQFSHIRGAAPEKTLTGGQASVLTWNICGEEGGLSYQKGVVQWASRLDRIVEKIQNEDPDLIVLQGVNDPALAKALISQLGDRYAHFFTHLGGGAWKNTNGCMVISKYAVHDFSHTDSIHNTSFETIEVKANPNDTLPALRLIATQLISGQENEEKQIEQVAQIVHDLAKKTLPLPTFLVGTDSNRESPTEKAFLSKYLHHSYRAEEPTKTDRLALQWNPKMKPSGETYDFISLIKRDPSKADPLPVVEKDIRLVKCYLIKAFDETYNTQTALSNHHGVMTIFKGIK